MKEYWKTRRSGRYAPILLAPAEGGGPFGPFWGPLAPSRVTISKLWILNFEKLEICVTLIAILRYIEAKFDYGFFIIFLHYGSKILLKKIQVIWSQNKGMTAIFLNFDLILYLENQCHTFIFAWNDLKFFYVEF